MHRVYIYTNSLQSLHNQCMFAIATMQLAVTILTLLVRAASTGASFNADGDCPLWTMPHNGSCKCANNLMGIMSCEDGKGATWLNKCFCMTAEESENNLPVVGLCLYTCDLQYPGFYYIGVNNSLNITSSTCGPYKRTGMMCGECLEGYGLPVYSYSLSCVECTSYKYNWLKYIAVSYIPLTVFYFLVVILRISATSGYMLGYVTICQMATIKAIASLLFSTTVKKHRIIIVLTISVLSPWNLDFFRYFYHPFCISPETTILQVLLLDYLVAVYPMILILLTYMLVKLHDNFRIAVYLCKPFYNACMFSGKSGI